MGGGRRNTSERGKNTHKAAMHIFKIPFELMQSSLQNEDARNAMLHSFLYACMYFSYECASAYLLVCEIFCAKERRIKKSI